MNVIFRTFSILSAACNTNRPSLLTKSEFKLKTAWHAVTLTWITLFTGKQLKSLATVFTRKKSLESIETVFLLEKQLASVSLFHDHHPTGICVR